MGVLAGKTALITGGGSGIGLGIAEAYHREAATVALCGRRAKRLSTAAEAIAPGGERILTVPADLTAPAEVERLLAAVIAAYGAIDVLVNCAGIMRFGPLEQVTLEDWRQQMEINTYAPWRLMQAVLPHMRRQGGGSIINISSISGLRPNPGSGIYCSTKAALQMMSQVLALEAADDGIRINLICPGMVEDTELGDAVFGPENVASFYPKLAPLHPLGRNGKPQDIAQAAVFLASDQSAWITGALLPVDGGRHMVMNNME